MDSRAVRLFSAWPLNHKRLPTVFMACDTPENIPVIKPTLELGRSSARLPFARYEQLFLNNSVNR